jgi:hypothetical protein
MRKTIIWDGGNTLYLLMHQRTRQRARHTWRKQRSRRNNKNPGALACVPSSISGFPSTAIFNSRARAGCCMPDPSCACTEGQYSIPSRYYQGQQQVSSMIEFCERPGSRRPSCLPPSSCSRSGIKV